jgi:5'-3' exonuclease
MGIPYYFYTIYRKYNDFDLTIKEENIKNIEISDVFLDYNSMIHPCAQQTMSIILEENGESGEKTKEEIENEIIDNCICYTRYIIDLINAKNIYIMIDGVAPRAKINQQRERRYKTLYIKEYIKEYKKNIESEEKDDMIWDTNNITPGTKFMDKIRLALDELAKEMKQYNKLLIISDSNECGEGEHKMMKCIEKIEDNNNESTNKKICIYGLDADLIMLSLLSNKRDKIVLMRDNTFNKKLKEIDRTYTYLDINQLEKGIVNEIRTMLKKDNNYKDELISDTNIINDYIFLCFLLGNDFMEHLPSLMIKENGVNVLIKYYIQNLIMRKFKPLINLQSSNLYEKINLELLMDIMYNLKTSEDYFFNNVYSVYQNDNSKYKDEIVIENSHDKNIWVYTNDIIKYNKKGYKNRYYMYYGIEREKIDVICKEYLEGLYWILGYYNGHSHNNWNWHYKYHATPFISDIYEYIKQNKNVFMEYIKNSNNIKESEKNSTLEQLFMVLPKKSLLNVIKEKDIELYNKMIRIFRNEYSRDLDKFYCNKITIDMINKEYLWQSKVFFDNLDKEIIKILIE